MKLKEIREAKGISQRKAALDLNLSPQVYNRYENGLREPPNALLISIADYFSVSVDEILGHDDKSRPPLDDKVKAMIGDLALLSPQEQQRVMDFVSGILSTRAR